ncbi:MAG: hypothetical protein KDA93_26215 [Planctomycetaceae bacterium]|nr:hypothetical protein [Planctomycetaceae bacterium]
MHVVGLDIGGANIKASDGERRSLSLSFPMWERFDELPQTLHALLGEFPNADLAAVTMTAELADCFSSKAEGVARILAAVEASVSISIGVWQTAGEFVPVEVAVEFPRLTAAANWHALATWAGRMVPEGPSLLLDMGSTTTDLIPLMDGMPMTEGLTDLERLLSGELAYTGFRRTPVCAIVNDVPLRDGRCPVAAELFATMDDVNVILGIAPEDSKRCDTADGRPATRTAAFSRLAHQLCCDSTELSEEELISAAECIRDAQLEQISGSLNSILKRLAAHPRTVLLCGEGESVLREVVQRSLGRHDVQVISLTKSLGPTHSSAACAFALARLARERLTPFG